MSTNKGLPSTMTRWSRQMKSLTQKGNCSTTEHFECFKSPHNVILLLSLLPFKKKRGKGKQFIWTLQYAIVETLTYKQTIDVKGLHSIPRSLSDNILRIPQNGVLIPVNNERIFVGSAVSLIEKHTPKFQIIT